MAVLSKAGITNNSTIQASHITQSIDALTGQVTDYNITISGSLAVTGSFEVFRPNTSNRVFYKTSGSGNNIEQHYLVPDVQDWIVGQDGRDNKFKISSADISFASQSVALTINSSGEVSIGTTSSLARLHVNPANTNSLITSLFTIGQSDNGFKAGFANGAGNTTGSEQAKVGMWSSPTLNSTANPVTHIGFIRGNSTDGSGMTFNVNNTETMRISGSNVGIGTSTPQGPLHIRGISDGSTTPAIFLDTNGTSNNEPVDIRLASGSARGIRIIASSSLSGTPGGASIQFYSNTAANYGGQFFIDSGTTGSSALIFRTADTATPVTERMRIAGNGTVSITGSLSISGSITSSGAISSSAGLFGTTLTTTGAITSSGAISSSAGLFGTTLRTSGAITSSGAISSSAGLFSATLTTTGAITASIISASSGITASILTLILYSSLPTSASLGSLAVSGSGAAMRLMLRTGSNANDWRAL